MTFETSEPTSATAGTVDRALQVLDILRLAREPLGVREIARRAGASPATAHRLLASLRAHGLVEQDGGRTYRLGWALLDYANALLADVRLSDVCPPIARRLRDETQETVSVQIPVGLDRVCIHESEGLHEVRRRVGVGRRVPLHAGASGRAILAFLPGDVVDAVLARAAERALTPATETRRARLLTLLEETRRTGVARSVAESAEGVASMATPVFDGSGAVAGSIAVSGPADRWTEAVMASHEGHLMSAALEASRGLGFRGSVTFHPPGSEGPSA